MKNINRILIALVLISSYSFSQDTAHQFQMNFYQQKIHKYLDKEKLLSVHYTIDKEGIKIYASAQDKTINKIEFIIDWDKLDAYKAQLRKCLWEDEITIYKQGKYNGVVPCQGIDIKKDVYRYDSLPKKLQGLKIAIDAGHTAGTFEDGIMEMKYLNFKKDSIHGLVDSIQIAEGMLTFATAQLLKEKLEAEGAIVFLTRKKNGFTAYDKTFAQWLKDDYKNAIDSLFNEKKFNAEKWNWYLSSKRTKREKFSLIFKDLELTKRAQIINNFHPDFTIIVHYNVDETNTGWTKPATKNMNMTFIGGAFMSDDLSSAEKRFEFLRMIISDDIEQSVKLSGAVVASFEKVLKVKIAGATDAKYLREGCIATSVKGVYCRNLQLTRYVQGPLVYGETLFQDNVNECIALNKDVDKTKNERVQQVAEAYYHGIMNYVSTLSTK